jgi:hypothetical protein
MTFSSSASFSAPVESLPSTSVESSTSSEVSSDDHLNEIQRQNVANAMLMARSLSPEQLQKRTRQLSDQLSAIDTTDQATDHSTSSADPSGQTIRSLQQDPQLVLGWRVGLSPQQP